MPEDYIRTGEFDRTMETLNEKIDKGFESVHNRFDHLEPEVLQHAKDIAVLKYQAEQAEKAARVATEQVQSTKSSTRNRATAWGTGAAGLVWVLVEFGKAIKTYMTGG